MNSRLRIRASIAAALAAAAVTSIFAGTAFAAPPANDNFSNRQDLGSTLPTSVTGTTSEATAETGEPDHSGEGGAGASIWYQWIAPASQTIVFDACDDSFPVLAVYTGLSVGALTPVAADGDCRATVDVTSGVTYKIALDGLFEEGATNLVIRATVPPPNDAFGAAVSLGGGTTFSAAGSTVDATREAGETDPNDSAGSVWYTWAPASSGEATVDTCTSEGDPTLTVYTGSAVNALTPVAANDDDLDCAAANEFGSKVTFQASAGATYRIAVAALCSGFFCEGTFTLNGSQVVPNPTPPANPQPNPPAAKKCKKGQKLKKGKCVKKKKKRKKGKK